MKRAFYFAHDYNARNDRKMTRLMMKHGIAGIGAFWCIVEMLYEEGGELPTEYDSIAFELRSNNDIIKSVIEDFDLFIVNGSRFYSESIKSRLKVRDDKSITARENIRKRWDKNNGNTTVIPPKQDRNTIKGKERKGKNSMYARKKKILEYKPETEEETTVQNWLNESYPRVQSLELPLVAVEVISKVKAYGKEKVIKTLSEMENKKDLLSKYIDAGRTLENWLNDIKK